MHAGKREKITSSAIVQCYHNAYHNEEITSPYNHPGGICFKKLARSIEGIHIHFVDNGTKDSA